MSGSSPKPKEIREIVTFQKGKPPAQQPYFGYDAETYLTPEYLRGGIVTEPIKASSNAVRVIQGDTIILWDGSNAGEVFRARTGVLSSTMTCLRHSADFDKSYFSYALKGWEAFLKGQTSGSGIPHVDKEVLGKLEILEFEKPEQTKIAEILSTVDRAIEQTEFLIAKQQRLKTGLMQDLLTRGIDEHGNLRSEQTHAFKNSPLGRIPVEWGAKKLSDVTSKLITYGIVQPGVHVADGIPFIQTKNLKGTYLDTSNMDRTSHEIHAAYTRSAVRAGDIVMGIRASVGVIAQVPRSLDGTNISRGVARLAPSEAVLGGYLFWITQSECIQRSIRLEIKGSTYPEITLPALRNILIPAPSAREQNQIARTLDAEAMQIEMTEKRLLKLRSLKTALMQDLLTGRKRVTNLLNEAEVPK